MILKILSVFLFNVVITVVTETIAAVCLGIRNKWDLLMIALFNVCTNLTINLIYYAFGAVIKNTVVLYIILGGLEIAVVFTEAFLFQKNLLEKKNYYLVSLVLNLVSFAAGMMIYNLLLKQMLGF